MYATIRRYERVDHERSDELSKKVGESLMPRLSKLPGFGGYYLLEASNGAMTSIGFFENASQADESTRVAADWVREEKLESALPVPPVVTSGEIVLKEMNGIRV
jgi:hypothetical protein